VQRSYTPYPAKDARQRGGVEAVGVRCAQEITRGAYPPIALRTGLRRGRQDKLMAGRGEGRNAEVKSGRGFWGIYRNSKISCFSLDKRWAVCYRANNRFVLAVDGSIRTHLKLTGGEAGGEAFPLCDMRLFPRKAESVCMTGRCVCPVGRVY